MEKGGLSRRVFVGGAAAFALVAAKRPAVDAPRARGFVMSASYRASPRLLLPNTTRDGDLIAEGFRKLRFGSVERVADPGPAAFPAAFARYLTALDRDSLAFLYLCGHGVQISGQNYILLEDGETYVGIVSMVEAARKAAGRVVLLLDACRNNPFRGQTVAVPRSRAVTLGAGAVGGVADVSFLDVASDVRPEGQLSAFQLQGSGVKIVFATDPANVALDGVTDADVNSPFAIAVAKRLAEKKSFDDIMALVTGDVVAATGGDQSPWSQGSLGRPIFLAGPPPNVNPARPPFNVPG